MITRILSLSLVLLPSAVFAQQSMEQSLSEIARELQHMSLRSSEPRASGGTSESRYAWNMAQGYRNYAMQAVGVANQMQKENKGLQVQVASLNQKLKDAQKQVALSKAQQSKAESDLKKYKDAFTENQLEMALAAAKKESDKIAEILQRACDLMIASHTVEIKSISIEADVSKKPQSAGK